MPRSRRAPIDYQPQFGGGIFRPKEDVEADLDELEHEGGVLADEPAVASRDESAGSAIEAGATDGASRRPLRAAREQPAERTDDRSNERTNERIRTRHSFDIWQDQLLALTEIQVQRFNRTGRKPKLGELVQEALDAYIGRERERTNVRTNERPYERAQR